MAKVVDERRRIVIPKHVAKSLGITSGDMVVFEKIGDRFAITKTQTPEQRLERIMDQNPERTGEPQKVSPAEMKEIWRI